MKKSKLQKRNDVSKFLMKLALVVVPTAIITFFMPHADEFTYKYEVGSPWNYGTLYSKYKFPVLKTDSVIEIETKAAIARFKPYYNLNSTVRNTAEDSLISISNKLKESWDAEDVAKYRRHLEGLLDTVFSKGVMTEPDREKLESANQTAIRILVENNAVVVNLEDVFTPHNAYEYIMTADLEHFPRTRLQEFDVHRLVKQNLSYDEGKSQTELESELGNVSSTGMTVNVGEKIVDKGENITPELYQKLKSYEKDYGERNEKAQFVSWMTVGQTAFVAIIMVILVSYLSLFRADYFDNMRSGLLLFGLPVFFCVIAALMMSHMVLNVFLLPFCMVAIVIRVFMDSRTAFMFHCATVLIVSLMLSHSFEFLILQCTTGMIAIQSLRVLTERSQIIRTAFLIFVAYIAVYVAFCMLRENDLKVDTSMFIWLPVNGVLLLFTYPLLWVFEKGMGFVSDVTLVELGNISNPVLQRMSEIAPGTFQHSMQVANLSAEVARKIGAKPLLVRTAALYHDIGKIDRAVFFTENQNGISPHKHLTPIKSAEVIIDHVNKGLALADKHHIPELIKDFIRSHHGTGKAKYFYITYKNEHPDEVIDEKAFTYPGPNPSSKEEAILMMCDGCEAASRSLSEYTEDSISQLVDRIIDGQMADGFYSECDISFKDIAIAKTVLKEKLKTIYHTRISYPELTGTKETTEKKENEEK